MSFQIFFSLFYFFLHFFCVFKVLLFLLYFCTLFLFDHSRVMIKCIFFQALTISIRSINHSIHRLNILFKVQLLLLFQLFFCSFMSIRHNLIYTINTCLIDSRLRHFRRIHWMSLWSNRRIITTCISELVKLSCSTSIHFV